MLAKVTEQTRSWAIEKVQALKDEHIHLSPVEWACENRYLPDAVTPMPGPYRIEVTPYLEEPLECLAPYNPTREIAIQKGAQVSATVGLIENFIGYSIDHIGTAPMMMITADGELAQQRIEVNIVPMLIESGLFHLIQSSDETNKKKTGITKKLLQWKRGGFLIPMGALNQAKTRSTSIRYLMRDEVDSYPLAGKDGDFMTTSFARTKGFEDSRKVIDLSTPSLKPSLIENRFEQGDKCFYNVPCKKCGKLQVLEWHGTHDGRTYGIKFDLDGEKRLITDSVRYECKFCGHPHKNDDKTWMMAKKNGAKWVPTQTPKKEHFRSFHISALYSPVGMQSWRACVEDWLEAWDVESNSVKDPEKLQAFNNNIRGVSHEFHGSRILPEHVSHHRRMHYRKGQISNAWCTEYLSSPVQFLTMTVDVHKSNLAVSVMGWCRGQRCVVIEYQRFEDKDCTSITSPVWETLADWIENKEWTASDKKVYKVSMTFIDSQYSNDTVVSFCSQYQTGVFPIAGSDRPMKAQRIKEFTEFQTSLETTGYRITVDHYKDRIAPALRREWQDVQGVQGMYSFNAPVDITDKELLELTKEQRKRKYDDKGRPVYYWERVKGADNELFDLLVYGHAAVEVIAKQVLIDGFGMEKVDWSLFWDHLEAAPLYRLPPEKDEQGNE